MFEAGRGRKLLLPAAIGAMAFTTLLLAGPGPEIKVRLTGSTQQHSSTGMAWVNFKDGSEVPPGERILYKLDLTNQGDKEAQSPTALGPIPAGTAYVPGTASTGENVKLAFSLDGGKTFAEKPTLTVTGKDGKTQVIPAPADRYTNIRWIWQTPLPAGATSTVSYQVQVR
jgi:uncharacterized repeat protein (TIGR01451 family)